MKNPYFRLFPFIVFLLCSGELSAQKVLQLEKAGSLNTIKIPVGSNLVFQFKNDDTGWYERTILDIDVERERLIFYDAEVPVDSISMISLKDRMLGPIILGTALQAGGANIIIFDLYYGVGRNRGSELSNWISGGANILIGTLIKKIFRRKKFKIGKKKRLRVLDLNFYKPGT